MACKYICDGYGKEMPASKGAHDYCKPYSWFQRGDDDGIQDACCRECIEKIAAKSGKTSTVMPI